MSVTLMLDTITEWAKENICSKITLKEPPTDPDAPVDAGYEYKQVNPAAFAMYVPTADKNPPKYTPPFPSLCVRFEQGEDDLAGGNCAIDVQFCFSAWNPGCHSKNDFERNGDGWRDVWNFVDTAKSEIEKVTHIGNYIIDPAIPIKFGPLKEQEAIPDYYPYWFAWLSFRVTYPLRRSVPDIKNLL